MRRASGPFRKEWLITSPFARAAPDGYTLVIGGWSTHVVNAAIYALQYDVLNDLEPIALLTNNSSLIVAKKTMPAHDLKSLIAWLKADRRARVAHSD